jgi:hypothetical protein
VRAVVFVIALALRALKAGPDLSTNTDAVADLDGLDCRSNLYCLAHDFVTDADGRRGVSPTTRDGVHVGATNTAALNLDIDIIVTKLLWLEL